MPLQGSSFALVEDGEHSMCSIRGLGGAAISDCMCLSMGHDVVDYSYLNTQHAP